jgi:hypothetical protein
MLSDNANMLLSPKFDESGVKARSASDAYEIFKNYARVSQDRELVKAAEDAVKLLREYAHVIEDITLIFIKDNKE